MSHQYSLVFQKFPYEITPVADKSVYSCQHCLAPILPIFGIRMIHPHFSKNGYKFGLYVPCQKFSLAELFSFLVVSYQGKILQHSTEVKF